MSTSSAYSNVAGVVDANSFAQSQDSYTKWAIEYDHDMDSLQAGLASGAAASVMRLITSETEGIRILDLAAGTGLVGVELKKLGFKGNIEGIDANKELLEVARKTGIYSKLSEQAISEDEKLNADLEAYDFVTCVGALIPHHVPASSVKAMVSYLKKGGKLVYTTRTTTKNVEYKQELDLCVNELVNSGILKFIRQDDVTHFGAPDPVTGNVVTSSLFSYIKCV